YEFRLHGLDSPTPFYGTATAITTVGPNWATLAQADLTAADFTPLLGGDEHPDLSTGRWRFKIAISAQRPSGSATWGGRYLVDNIEMGVTAPEAPAGPRVLLHAPTRAPDDIFYAREPISRIQVAFDQPMNFTAADVTLTSATAGPINGATITG